MAGARAHLTASTMLVLPEPLGPTMAVTPPSNRISVGRRESLETQEAQERRGTSSFARVSEGADIAVVGLWVQHVEKAEVPHLVIREAPELPAPARQATELALRLVPRQVPAQARMGRGTASVAASRTVGGFLRPPAAGSRSVGARGPRSPRPAALAPVSPRFRVRGSDQVLQRTRPASCSASCFGRPWLRAQREALRPAKDHRRYSRRLPTRAPSLS